MSGARSEPGASNPPARERLGLALFAAAIFCSAFLLFLVQPMVGKRILPWFGGSPGVWTLCLAFYQTTLFLGYAWAHLLIRHARPTRQLFLHAAGFAAALLVLPVLPGDGWRPASAGEPTAAILAMLAASVALPFAVLAATGPLVQAWFARGWPGRSPYALYAVSNGGSLLALLGYPFWIEPRFPLSAAGGFWSWAFAATGVLVLGCGLRSLRTSGSAAAGSAPPAAPEAAPPRSHVALWLLLPACAVVLLMGVTNQLCLDLASVPFLWVLPLAAYLVSFIVGFGLPRAYARLPFAVLAAAGVFGLYATGLSEVSLVPDPAGGGRAAVRQIALYCTLLFAACMLLHGELYRLRPAPRQLTAFYLSIAAGGALGGVAVGIGAPRLFDGYHELPLGLAASGLVLLAIWGAEARRGGGRARLGFALAAVVWLVASPLLAARVLDAREGQLHVERTFFGVLRVVQAGEGAQRRFNLSSGTTLHGSQLAALRERLRPTAYFGVATGIGIALTQREAGEPRRMGIIGLGIGTLARYARAGDPVRFYEIDPAVVRIAQRGGYFSFLAESPGEIEIVTGDARVQLSEEQRRGAAQDFDVLVVDAFSSDAIPMHLLTEEAFAVYAQALRPGGLLAVHVSNRYFDLPPLVARGAASAGMQALEIRNRPVPEHESRLSRWVFASRDGERLRSLAAFAPRRIASLGLPPDTLRVRVLGPEARRGAPRWTDDYGDLWSVLARRDGGRR